MVKVEQSHTMHQLKRLTSKSLIYMDYEFVAAQLLAPAQINNNTYKMLIIFKSLLKYKLWKYELHKNLDTSCIAMDEKVCINLTFIIAIRQIFNMTEPVNYGVDIGLLDKELRQELSEYLSSYFNSLN